MKKPLLTKEHFRYFNSDTMAVYRSDNFIYTLYQSNKDKKWYCNINVCTISGLINNFAVGEGKESFEDALEDCRKKAAKLLKNLVKSV